VPLAGHFEICANLNVVEVVRGEIAGRHECVMNGGVVDTGRKWTTTANAASGVQQIFCDR